MRYVTARLEQECRDEAYRIYVSDGLKAVCGFKLRYYDIVNQTQMEDADPEEIKASIFSKLEKMGDKNGPV